MYKQECLEILKTVATGALPIVVLEDGDLVQLQQGAYAVDLVHVYNGPAWEVWSLDNQMSIPTSLEKAVVLGAALLLSLNKPTGPHTRFAWGSAEPTTEQLTAALTDAIREGELDDQLYLIRLLEDRIPEEQLKSGDSLVIYGAYNRWIQMDWETSHTYPFVTAKGFRGF